MDEDSGYYSFEWPRDGLTVDIYVHEVMNYRYHWHRNDYELNILLSGSQDFCLEKKHYYLQENDVLLIPPGSGHGSFARTAGTRALVIHFPISAYRSLVRKGNSLDFGIWAPGAEFRSSLFARKIRFIAAELYCAASSGTAASQMAVRGLLMQILACLYDERSPREINLQSADDDQKELIFRFTDYIDKHYSEKVTLEDLANYSQYNRTYISTLFRNAVGVGFHDYLTRVRFQHALLDLAAGQTKSLTEIALDNGFPDLKSLNKYCIENLDRTPAEYRAQVDPSTSILTMGKRQYVSPDDSVVQAKAREYMRLADFVDSRD